MRITLAVACATILYMAAVAPRAVATPPVTGTEAIDSLLADALVTQLDAVAAIQGAGNQVSRKPGLAPGVPSYLDASVKGTAECIEKLKAAHSDDPSREGVRKRLLERLENLGKAVDLESQAIRA